MIFNTSNPEYSQFIATSRYARWLPAEGRRETWEETVTRYVDYMVSQAMSTSSYSIDESTYHALRESILNLEVMLLVRLLIEIM